MTRWWGVGRCVEPPILIEKRRGIAPRPVVGFGDIPAKASHDIFEAVAFQSLDESLLGVSFSYLVRIDFPELRKYRGGRGPFRGRRGNRVRVFRKGGVGGNLRRGRCVRVSNASNA